ncbi:hypothetical protein ACEQPO_18190 [Bacillus sp. SL00103]
MAKAHPEDMASYINGKDAIIKEIEQGHTTGQSS